MKENFEYFLDNTFRVEGGYVNHPKDPGGPTNMGITQAVLSEHRGRKVSANDVKNLSRQEAGEIYRKRYWNKVKGDSLPGGIDLYVADFAVHSGPDRSVRYLQGVLGVTQDGVVGPITLRAAQEKDPVEVIEELHKRRMAFLKGLSTWATFGKGWTRRCDDVLVSAKSAAYQTGTSSAGGLLKLLIALIRKIFNV